MSAGVCEQRQLFPADFRGNYLPSTPVYKGSTWFPTLSLCVLVFGAAIHYFEFALSFVVVFGFVRLLRSASSRQVQRAQKEPLAKPLMVHEIRHLQQMDRDTLSRSYLELVIAAIDTPCAEDTETEHSVREAILALATSMINLPPQSARDAQENPASLQAEAGKLTAEADQETDAIVASSLRRRAEALMRQAEIAGQTAVLLRRNEALRLEVAGQIAALQTSLTALRVGGSQAVYELAGVAASIQQVALEAGALTQARSEIGEIVNVVSVQRTE